jgi:predicted nucleotidyltransferase
MSDVWSMLNRHELIQIARSGPEPLFATVSGAHLYGFASPNSDVDLRGAFILKASELLGMRPARETLSIEEQRNGIDLDWVAHDIRKFARLLTQHNGYALEQLYSPLIVISSLEHEELCELGKGCITRPTVRHYLGFAHGRRTRLREPDPTVKHLLYAYRVYLSGIHLMQAGEVDANLQNLNQRFELSYVSELVARKQAGEEAMPLQPGEVDAHEPLLDALETRLHEAHAHSSLPEEPTTIDALDAFVIRIRLARLNK